MNLERILGRVETHIQPRVIFINNLYTSIY